ncbi:flagellin [Halodesulfovibrio marinisediminis DSM 17456]|uniref:Flagellin n=1 Tax=Halodesulfovibrio marinisediminis DSM 17456 TaxID=1121457 RepID=A0A1N6I6L2_9BACT|nr:flagellin [Halodesulfovibrio marinisediminis DSM 17456]
MSLAINHNMLAVNSRYSLNQSYKALGTSTERLSSGLRIGTAADDAAGLAIRELMRADIKTLGQGLRNANDGISMIQTADGALGVIDAQLIRMKELAQQAATGTYTDEQRVLINEEYQKVAQELTRIAESSVYNTKQLLNGYQHNFTETFEDPTATGSATVDTAAQNITSIDAGDTVTFKNINKNGFTVTTTATFSHKGSGGTAPTKAAYTYNADGTTSITPEPQATPGAQQLVSTESYTLSKQYEPSEATSVRYEFSKDGGKTWEELPTTAPVTTKAGEQIRVTADYPKGEVTETFIDPRSTDPALAADNAKIAFTFNPATHTVSYSTVPKHTASPTLNATQIEENGAQAKADLKAVQATIETDSATTIKFTFGARNEAFDHYGIKIEKVSAKTLGIGQTAHDDVLTQKNALKALKNIDKAIVKKDAIRARVGATQNRLAASIDNISIQRENAQASESTISDVDVASEMVEFNRRQLMANAAMAILVQANSLPETARQLLSKS